MNLLGSICCLFAGRCAGGLKAGASSYKIRIYLR